MTIASKSSVVVQWAEGRSALCAIRSLARKGVKVTAVSSDPRAMGFYSKFASERILLPPYEGDLKHYTDGLLRLCKRKNVLTVMPFREGDVYILCSHRDELENHVSILWPTRATFECVRDRIKLLDMARSNGVPVPKTGRLSQWKDWSEPCVIKSRYSVMESNNGLFYHKPMYVMPNEPPDFDYVALEMKHDPIVQEYIVGPEYGYSALFNEGKMRASFQHRRILSLNYMGGASALREPTYVKKLEELGSRLLQVMKWHGPAMVEFKFDVQDKEFKLMEINPRFWGSLNLAVEAGIDFPYLYYKIASHGDCESVYDYRRNIVSHYLAGELSYLASLVRVHWCVGGVSGPSMLGQMRLILGTLGHSKFDVLDRKDIRPCLMYLLSICSRHNLRRFLSAA